MPIRRVRQKRMSLLIPLPVWNLMRDECIRRSATAGGSVSLSMLVVQVMTEVLPHSRRTDGRATTSSVGTMSATQ